MSCTLGYHSDTKCVAVGVWSDPDRCRSDASIEAICGAAQAVEVAAGSCAEESAGGGLMWGMILSLVGDVVISVGLALQKVAHNRLKAQEEGGAGKRKKTAHLRMPVWWLGFFGMLVGEICNFVAYGDSNTPASVVTAVGCVGIIANNFISTLCLGEPFRRRDMLGSSFVIAGVALIVIFAPNQSCPLTAGRFSWLLAQPGAIILLVFTGLVLALLCGYVVPRYAERHVLIPISCASLLGSLTVLASKAVSTFVQLTLAGIADPHVPFSDQVDLTKGEEACLADGHHYGDIAPGPPPRRACVTVEPWYAAVNNSAGEIIIEGAEQLTSWPLYVCLLLLIGTAVAQVNYINRGMVNFGNSQLIPAHYVTFTLFSVLATSTFYQARRRLACYLPWGVGVPQEYRRSTAGVGGLRASLHSPYTHH